MNWMLRAISLAFAISAFALPHSGHAQTKVAAGPCSSPAYHLMDYLIGDWDAVETQSGVHFLFNKVEAINDGCAVRETLHMKGDVPGTSISFRSSHTGRWYSYYQAPGQHAVFEGTTDAAGVSDLLTQTYLPGSEKLRTVRQVTQRDSHGRPRQLGYLLKADGAWKMIWDLTFCSMADGGHPTAPCDKAMSRP